MVASSLVQLFTDCVGSLHSSFKGRTVSWVLPSSSLSLEDKAADRRQPLLQSFMGGFPSHIDDLLNIAYYQLYSGTSLLVSIATRLICTLIQ